MSYAVMFPAHAGMNRHGPLIDSALYDVPRTRGDEPYCDVAYPPGAKCSPHTRG